MLSARETDREQQSPDQKGAGHGLEAGAVGQSQWPAEDRVRGQGAGPGSLPEGNAAPDRLSRQ